jgi:hypothetical protein
MPFAFGGFLAAVLAEGVVGLYTDFLLGCIDDALVEGRRRGSGPLWCRRCLVARDYHLPCFLIIRRAF